MFRGLKKWFVPCRANNYEPHLLRAWPVVLLLLVIVSFFGTAQFLERTLTTTTSNLAAVVSSVLVDLTNFDRAEEGLHGLSVNPTLVHAAQLKANDMAEASYFAHNSPDGKTPWYWFTAAGYEFAYAGENLAVFFGDSEDVNRAWMNSPSHRANILNSNFTEIGIATAEGYYQGQKTVFVVQMFGAPSVRPHIATLESQPGDTASAVAFEADDGAVSGEAITTLEEAELIPEGTVTILHQDDTFIAVKSDAPIAPSARSPEVQSSAWERMIASPQTTLTYIYAGIGGLVALALILLIFLEMRVQKPKNILYGAIILLVLGVLVYVSYTSVVVAGVESVSGALDVFS